MCNCQSLALGACPMQTKPLGATRHQRVVWKEGAWSEGNGRVRLGLRLYLTGTNSTLRCGNPLKPQPPFKKKTQG